MAASSSGYVDTDAATVPEAAIPSSSLDRCECCAVRNEIDPAWTISFGQNADAVEASSELQKISISRCEWAVYVSVIAIAPIRSRADQPSAPVEKEPNKHAHCC
jgi:hypothetical protein